ncbi:MAG: VanZ family protein [Flavobacteriales bacterium]|nr:VanZ family protein [Flavobacteriales bacterium]
MVWRHLLPSILWTALILFLYAIPGGNLPGQDFLEIIPLDKLAHFVFFMVYALILNVGIAKQINIPRVSLRASVFTVIWCVLFGSTLEMIQGTVFVDRTTDIMDLITNILGSIVGVVIFKVVYGHLSAR